ncbi:MAG: PKD domain-containing protein [Acidobacteria bacterium]|nr:PKD domain-containing protein [Acidobacteriota bacterium]
MLVVPFWRLSAQEQEPAAAPDQAPSIAGLSPASGPVLTLVTVTGGPFSLNRAENLVTFGAVKAPSHALSPSQMEVLVPENLAPGVVPVIVTTAGLSSAPVNFAVTTPASPGTLGAVNYNLDIGALSVLGFHLRTLTLQARTTLGSDLAFPFPGSFAAGRGIFPTPYFPGLDLPGLRPGSTSGPVSLYATPLPGRTGAGRDQLTSDLSNFFVPPQVYSATGSGLSSFANSISSHQPLPAGAGTVIYPPVFAANPNYNPLSASPSNPLVLSDVYLLTTGGVVRSSSGSIQFIPLPPGAGEPIGPLAVQRNPQFGSFAGAAASPFPFLEGFLLSTTGGLVIISGGVATLIPFPSGAGLPVGPPVYRGNPNFNPLAASGVTGVGDDLPILPEILVATTNGLVTVSGGTAGFIPVPAGAGRVLSQPVDQLNPNFNLFASGNPPLSDVALFTGATLLACENGLATFNHGAANFVPLPAGAGRVVGPPISAPNAEFNAFFPLVGTGSQKPFVGSTLLATSNGLVSINDITADFSPVPSQLGEVLSPPVFLLNPLFNPQFTPADPGGSVQPFTSASYVATTEGMIKIDQGQTTFTPLPAGSGMPTGTPIPVTILPGVSQFIIPVSNGVVVIDAGVSKLFPAPQGAGTPVGPPLRISPDRLLIAFTRGVLELAGETVSFFPAPAEAGEIVSTPIYDPSPSAGSWFLLTSANGFLRFSNGIFGFFPLPGSAGTHLAPRISFLPITSPPRPPVANAGPDRTVNEGATVIFDGSASAAPDGTLVLFQWDFGDGTAASGQVVGHTYIDNGLFVARLTVTDSNGLTGTVTVNVSVLNVAPTVNAGPDRTAGVGEVVAFQGSFFDPGNLDTHTFRWEFGDGSSTVGTLTPTHVYATVGLFTVTLTVTDKDGASGVGSARVNVIDTTPPRVSLISPAGGEVLLPGALFTIRWNSSDNVGVVSHEVRLSTDGGNSFPTLLAGGLPGASQSFDWLIPTNLVTSVARVQVTARDGAGNTGSGVSGIFTVRDTIPPQVTVTAPTAGQTINAGSNFTIRWTSFDNVGVTSHNILLSTDGGVNFFTAIATNRPGGESALNWSVPSTLVGNNVRIRVLAFDAAGNSGSGDSGAFTVRDATPPTVLLQAPFGNENLNPASNFLIRWTASDNVGVVSIELLLSTDGGSSYPIVIATGLPGTQSSYNWQIPGTLSTSTARVRVIARDAAGNQGQDSSFNFTIRDTIPPSVTIIAPAAGQSFNPGATLGIQWTASDNVGVVSQDVLLSTDGGFNFNIPIASGLQGSQQSFNWNIPGSISTTTAQVRVTARDFVGLTGSSQTGNFSIRDTMPPTVNIVAPSNGQTVSAGTNFTIQWSSIDNVGVVSQDVLLSTNGGSSFPTVIASSLPGNQQAFTWPVPANLSLSNARIRVTARDAANNSGSGQTGNFSIRDNVPPTISLVTPVGGEILQPGISFLIQWNSFDNVGVTAHDLQLSTNGGNTFSNIGSTGPQQNFSWNVPGVNSTQARIRVTARDAANNSTSATSSNFTIRDNTPPSVTITAPNGSEQLDPSENFTIRWTSTDNVGVVSQDLLFSSNGGGSFSTIQSNLGGSISQFNWNVPSVTTSQARIRVVARDAVGLVGQADSNLFTIIGDSQSPTVNIQTPVNGESVPAGSQYQIQWNSSDNVGVVSQEVLFSSNSGGSFQSLGTVGGAVSSFNWSVPNIITANARIRVTARDAANNSGQDTTGNFRIVDATSPSVNLTQPTTGANLQAGTTFTIRWTSNDNIGVDSHDLLFSSNGGGSFANIQTGLSGGQTQYNWTVPSTSTMQARIRIVARDNAGNTNQDTTGNFRISLPNAPPTVQVVAPNGGEVLMSGGSFLIQWVSSDDVGLASHDILLSTNGGSTFPVVISSGLPGTASSFNWTVPNLSTTRARVRVIARDGDGNSGNDASDADFTIQSASGIGAFALVAAGDVTVLQGLPGSGSIFKTVPIPGNATEVAVAPNGLYAIVLSDSSSVTVLTGTGTGNPVEVSTLNLSADPAGVAISPDSSYAVVLVDTSPASLVLINGLPGSPSLGSPFTLSQIASGAQDLALASSGTVVVTGTTPSGDGIAVVDGVRPGGTPTFRSGVRTGSDPTGVAFSADERTAFVVIQGNNTVVPVSGMAPGGTLSLGRPVSTGSRPRGIDVSMDGTVAVVTNGNGSSATVFSVSGATLSQTAVVDVGSQPAGVSIAKDGNTALVAVSGDRTISVISNLRSGPSAAVIGPSNQLRTGDDREQSVAYVP